jgi:hypothetical protein
MLSKAYKPMSLRDAYSRLVRAWNDPKAEESALQAEADFVSAIQEALTAAEIDAVLSDDAWVKLPVGWVMSAYDRALQIEPANRSIIRNYLSFLDFVSGPDNQAIASRLRKTLAALERKSNH